MSFSTPTAKYSVTIVTVDPTQGIIQGALKTGSAAHISVYNTPPAFRWPQVGEAWTVRQENGSWFLDCLWPPTSVPITYKDVDPGDLVLNSATGTVHVLGSPDGSTDFHFDMDSLGGGGGDVAAETARAEAAEAALSAAIAAETARAEAAEAALMVGGSGDLNFHYTQGAAASTWTITHNLGKYPSVTVIDSANDMVEGVIQYNSVNQLTLTFSGAFSGDAYLN
jgi:hypothetical protein